MGKCGKKCEVFSRVAGYYRPVQSWNDGKRSEFKDRRVYCEKKSLVSAENKKFGLEKLNADLNEFNEVEKAEVTVK